MTFQAIATIVILQVAIIVIVNFIDKKNKK